MKRILVIDDDCDTCRFLDEVFHDEGWEVESAQTASKASDVFAKSKFDLIVSDLNLGERLNGIDLLKHFRQLAPRTPVILISGFGSLETAVEAVREGAFDFISKPFVVQEVIGTVRRALEQSEPSEDGAEAELQRQYESTGIVGRSRKMVEIYKEIARVAPSKSTVLITGESGTGKELVARSIHLHSPRSSKNFVAVNCGALTETLLESELFGHVKGSFTGAISDKRGLFEEAHHGSIFLDEIADTTPALQVKLLRVLQEGEVKPVGGAKTEHVDVRVIAATNRDLEADVKSGRFRQDLYYRLSVVTLRLPALRERREDIPILARHFLRKACKPGGREMTLSDEVLAALNHYEWPGNVRELENTIEHAVLYARGNHITIDDLPSKFDSLKGARPGLARRLPMSGLLEDLPTLDELEKRYLQHVLEATGGNRTRAAQILSVDRRTLYRMAERFDIPLDEKPEK